jgi:hypothetical protein
VSGKIDYAKAKRRDQAREAAWIARKRGELDGPLARSYAQHDFAAEKALKCFKCRRADRKWAKTGVNARGAWAICVDCVDPSKRRQ